MKSKNDKGLQKTGNFTQEAKIIPKNIRMKWGLESHP